MNEYPLRENWKSYGWGYASDMVHLAVGRDDAEAFMSFLAECGGFELKPGFRRPGRPKKNIEVLGAGCIIYNYAASHGAVNCALAASGAKSDYPLDYWLKRAEKPSYGPKAASLGTGGRTLSNCNQHGQQDCDDVYEEGYERKRERQHC